MKRCLVLLLILANLSAYAMVDERLLFRSFLLEEGVPFREQVINPNTTYVIKNEFDLEGEHFSLPSGCHLVFSGGRLSNGRLDASGASIVSNVDSVLFGPDFVIHNISNKEVTLAWYNIDENDDIALLLRGLIQNPKVRTLNLAGKKFRTSYVDIDHSLVIEGDGAQISPIMKTEKSYKGVFRCLDGGGQGSFHFRNFSVVGDGEVSFNYNILGERLFWFNACEQVSFNNVVIGNITGGYGASKIGYDFNAGIIACYDVRDLSIQECEFYNNKRFEWICDLPVKLSKKEINVVFDGNYIHDSSEGATPVCFVCNKLSISNNKVRNCYYSGSLFNAHGYDVVLRDNDIKDCSYSSVFDTCEYGNIEKTEAGDPCCYAKRVRCVNNECLCANGTLLVTWAEQIEVSNNAFMGMCLCAAQGSDNLGPTPDPALVLPTCRRVSIRDNVCTCDYVDLNNTLSYYHNFVRSVATYDNGGIVEIVGNRFVRSFFVDDYPFLIQNAKHVVIKNNTILGCFKDSSGNGESALLSISSDSSYYYPLENRDVDLLEITGNTVLDEDDRITLVVQKTTTREPFLINEARVFGNNLWGCYNISHNESSRIVSLTVDGNFENSFGINNKEIRVVAGTPQRRFIKTNSQESYNGR